MFIKWRTYQRQLKGVKGDKYIQQPIIVESYRWGLKEIEAAKKTKSDRIPSGFFDSPEMIRRIRMPRHRVIWKLPSYPLCMVVYFRSPEFMKQRYHWWEAVDKILLQLVELEVIPTEMVSKLREDIEAVVPRVTPEQVRTLTVVLNDLPLQKMSPETEGDPHEYRA